MGDIAAWPTPLRRAFDVPDIVSDAAAWRLISEKLAPVAEPERGHGEPPLNLRLAIVHAVVAKGAELPGDYFVESPGGKETLAQTVVLDSEEVQTRIREWNVAAKGPDASDHPDAARSAVSIVMELLAKITALSMPPE